MRVIKPATGPQLHPLNQYWRTLKVQLTISASWKQDKYVHNMGRVVAIGVSSAVFKPQFAVETSMFDNWHD
jgi:hypothetical protein